MPPLSQHATQDSMTRNISEPSHTSHKATDDNHALRIKQIEHRIMQVQSHFMKELAQLQKDLKEVKQQQSRYHPSRMTPQSNHPSQDHRVMNTASPFMMGPQGHHGLAT